MSIRIAELSRCESSDNQLIILCSEIGSLLCCGEIVANIIPRCILDGSHYVICISCQHYAKVIRYSLDKLVTSILVSIKTIFAGLLNSGEGFQ